MDSIDRWDIYMNGHEDNQIHWFSITNSSVIVMFLTVLVAMIMVRALRKDIQRYNAEDMEEANEETGWKLVHGDVLRPPTTAPMLFAVSLLCLPPPPHPLLLALSKFLGPRSVVRLQCP